MQSQIAWQRSIAGNLSTSNIISAGVYFGTGSWSIPSLADAEGSAMSIVEHFSAHNYPQSSGKYDLAALMGHRDIARQIAQFSAPISAARSHGKPFLMGETNSGK